MKFLVRKADEYKKFQKCEQNSDQKTSWCFEVCRFKLNKTLLCKSFSFKWLYIIFDLAWIKFTGASLYVMIKKNLGHPTKNAPVLKRNVGCAKGRQKRKRRAIITHCKSTKWRRLLLCMCYFQSPLIKSYGGLFLWNRLWDLCRFGSI